MNRFLMLISAVGVALGLAACNTVRGLGQDIQKAGQTIEGAAKK